jgi:glycopeptide antibiotics resistance protein
MPLDKNVPQRVTLYSAVFYCFSVAALCFTPLKFVGHRVIPLVEGIGTINLVALYGIDMTFYLNIIMAVPMGIYYGLLILRASILKVFLVGILASTWVEVAQYILNHSILLNRSVDINDVISNVIGVLVGYGALKIFRLILPKLVQKFEYFTQV